MNDRNNYSPESVKAGLNRNKTILLVEDDADDCEFFTDALAAIEQVKVVHIASNGKEALEWLGQAEKLPDFIFTDINMPLMNGLELIASIKKNEYSQHIAVVVLSSDKARSAEGVKLGARSVINKNCSGSELTTQIERVIHPWLVKISVTPVLEPECQYLFVN